MTTEQEVAIARTAAKLVAFRRPDRPDHGEYLGAAWVRVRRHNRLHPGGDVALVAFAAKLGAMDEARHLAGSRRVLARVHDYDLTAVPDREPAAPVESRLLAAWCEYRGQRAGTGMMARVWAYLLRVEGWTLAEVAAVWGCIPNSVHRVVQKAGLTARREAR